MGDALKLFFKNLVSPNKRHKLVYYTRPAVSLILVIWLWLVISVEFEKSYYLFSVIYVLIILRLNVYPLLLNGWGSTNKYSITGALRRIAQTISYEIRLALIIIVVLVYLNFLDFNLLQITKSYHMIIFVIPTIFWLWLISGLAETNRTPFDFSEGERELVSGFNTEFGARIFALIFIAEYGSIYFLRFTTSIIFSLNVN
jgi:NADH-ubiquinone oxidoreductase chain 1